MLIKFPSGQERLAIIKHLRDLAREPWYPDEVDDSQLVGLDRAQARIEAHARRIDQAYTDFAALPRAA